MEGEGRNIRVSQLQAAKIEVESVVREAADRVLSDSTISKEKQHLRIVALLIMAEVGHNWMAPSDIVGIRQCPQGGRTPA